MNSLFNAPSRPAQSWRLRWWHILLFVALLLLAVFALFPQKSLIKLLINTRQPSQLGVMYLRNLVALYPQDAELHIALAEQEIGLGNFQNAKQLLGPYTTLTPETAAQWQTVFIRYQLIRAETYAFAENSPKLFQGEVHMKQLLAILVKSPNLSPEQLSKLAQDALGINQPKLAVMFYQRAIAAAPHQSVDFFVNAAKAALFVSDYQSSAQFYTLAMADSPDLDKKRFYYMAALNSLVQSGDGIAVMAFAEKSIDGLDKDQQTLIFLAKTAMQSGQLNAAEKYIKQALKFKYVPAPEEDLDNPPLWGKQ